MIHCCWECKLYQYIWNLFVVTIEAIHAPSLSSKISTPICCSSREQQLLSCVPTLCDSMYCSTSKLLFPPLSPSLLRFMSFESVMPPNHLVLCCPLIFLPSIFPNIRVFSNELALHIKWPKYWSFSFSISPSNEYSGMISFRMDWFDVLVVQGTLKGLL